MAIVLQLMAIQLIVPYLCWDPHNLLLFPSSISTGIQAGLTVCLSQPCVRTAAVVEWNNNKKYIFCFIIFAKNESVHIQQ